MDSVPSILQITAQSMIRSIGLKLDLGAFEGSGTAPEVKGLKNVASIGLISMGTDGAAFANLDPIAQAIGQIESANGKAGAIVMHPNVWTKLSTLKELASGSNKPLLQESAGSASQGLQRSITAYRYSCPRNSRLLRLKALAASLRASMSMTHRRCTSCVGLRFRSFRTPTRSSRRTPLT